MIVLDVVGDVFTKRFAIEGRWIHAIAAIVLFVVSAVAWLATLRLGVALSRVVVLYAVAALIAGTFVGIVVFGEHAGRLKFVGILLGVAAVICLSTQ
jgi:multidrug transporter EmrE-like cation transporter